MWNSYLLLLLANNTTAANKQGVGIKCSMLKIEWIIILLNCSCCGVQAMHAKLLSDSNWLVKCYKEHTDSRVFRLSKVMAAIPLPTAHI